MKAARLRIEDIQIRAGTQVRVELNLEVVEDYANALSDGVKLPPIQVFHDGKAAKYLVADGFHRLAAHKMAGRRVIEAIVGVGSRETAIIFAAGANNKHGLRMNRADKRRAVEMMLAATRDAPWSDREIASHVGVSNTFVGKVRAERGQSEQGVNVDGYPQADAPDPGGGGQGAESPETRADAAVDGGIDTPEAPDSAGTPTDTGPPPSAARPDGAEDAPAPQERGTAAATEPRKRGTEPEHDLADAVDALTERLRELEAENQALREEIDSMRERNEDESVRLIKRLKGDLQVAYSQRDDFMRQSNELKREIKSRDRQIERLKRTAGSL